MKANFEMVLNDLQFRKVLNSLSIADCKIAIGILQKRIERFENRKFPQKPKKRMLTEDFLKTPIEEFDLTVRAFNCLKNRGLNTVKDIKEFGIERLETIRHIGERTAMEIKTIVFHL